MAAYTGVHGEYQSGAADPITVNLSGATSVNDLLVLGLQTDVTVASISDSGMTTGGWTERVSQLSGASGRTLHMYDAIVTVGGATPSVTVDFTVTPGTNATFIGIYAFSGLDTTPLWSGRTNDQASPGTGTDAVTTGTTTSGNGFISIGFHFNQSASSPTRTAGTGYTLLFDFDFAAVIGGLSQYLVDTGSPRASTMTTSVNDEYLSAVVNYQPTAAADVLLGQAAL